MQETSDPTLAAFNEDHSWGARNIEEGKDLPNLKLRYLMELLAKRSNPDASLLELGCGSGRILTSIRERDANIQLTGIDVSQMQMEIVSETQQGKGIRYVNGDGQRLPFADNSFDYVIIMDFLEHIPLPQSSLNEVHRVLKQGGLLYAVIPAEREGIYGLSKKVFRRHFKEQTAGHIQQYSIRELESMTREAKLRIVDEKYSYHLIGSMLDYSLFTMMLHPKVYDLFWANNRYYQVEEEKSRSAAGKALNMLLTAGNALAYYESTALKKTRVGACAVHITATKP